MVLKGTTKGSKGTLENLYRFPEHTIKSLKVWNLFEGSRAKNPFSTLFSKSVLSITTAKSTHHTNIDIILHKQPVNDLSIMKICVNYS